jgi:hypothetical protein
LSVGTVCFREIMDVRFNGSAYTKHKFHDSLRFAWRYS